MGQPPDPVISENPVDEDLSQIRIAVLDEADHMSELGFLEPMQRILEIIRSADFRAAVATLPGYVPSDTGTVTGVKAFLEMHAVR